MHNPAISNPLDPGLRVIARQNPACPAVKHADGTTTSYAELEALANRLAHLFRYYGLRRGDHVAGILGNGPLMLALGWAAWRSGLYFTPVATSLTSHEMAYVVGNCRARVVIAAALYENAAGKLPQALPDVRYLVAGGTIAGFAMLEGALSDQPDHPIEDETPGAIMLYSSGTTGTPKGVWRPLPEIADLDPTLPLFVRDIVATFGIRASDRYLSTGPLYHAAPLRWSLAITAMGGCVYLIDRFDADLALTILERDRITLSQWVPTMFHRVLALPADRRLSFHAPYHRGAFHSAAPISANLKRAMIAWWGPIVFEYYGGSESVGFCLISTAEWLERPGSVGRAKKGEIHILDAQSHAVPTGATGRVYFSGTTRFEYFGEPEKTAARTSAQGYQTFGDIGHVDRDAYLFLTDRQDDAIISGGVNIYPQEIENVLQQVPGVEDVAVIGRADPEFGERAIAFVQPKADVADRDKLHADIVAHCREWLGKTKQPKEIRFVDALPRSDAGKLLRRLLRDTADPAE